MKRGVCAGSIRTPVSDSQRLFCPGVEHGADDHEPRRDRPLAHAQNEPNREKTAEILASGVRTERHTPYEDVYAGRRQISSAERAHSEDIVRTSSISRRGTAGVQGSGDTRREDS